MTDFYFEDVVWFSDDGRGEQEVEGGALIEVDVPPGMDLDYCWSTEAHPRGSGRSRRPS